MTEEDRLRIAVNAACSCGGGQPGKCCDACLVWHIWKANQRMRENPPPSFQGVMQILPFDWNIFGDENEI